MKTLFAFLFTLGALTVAQAQTSYTISLDSGQEVPPNGSTATGSGTATLTGTTLSISLNYTGLTGPPSLGHIHGPAAAGANASPIFNFNVTGLGTSGSISTNFTYTAQQITDLNNLLHYVNLHTAANGGGEIRGQIVPVPEPSTLALLGLGAGALVLRLRRKN